MYFENQRRSTTFGSADTRIGFEQLLRTIDPSAWDRQWLAATVEREQNYMRTAAIMTATLGAAATAVMMWLGLHNESRLQTTGALVIAFAALTLLVLHYRRVQRLRRLETAIPPSPSTQ